MILGEKYIVRGKYAARLGYASIVGRIVTLCGMNPRRFIAEVTTGDWNETWPWEIHFEDLGVIEPTTNEEAVQLLRSDLTWN